MRKILSFSGFLMLRLVVSQFLPMVAGDGHEAVKSISNVLFYVCPSSIIINVGRELVLDKTRWKSYIRDYFTATTTVALPWFMIAIYCVFILLPPEFWNSWEVWRENLLLNRLAASTSAGILFTMLVAIGPRSSWIYRKIQVLAIFDDLDMILLMIPLQVMVVELRWQSIIVAVIVFLFLPIGWQRSNKYDWRQDWEAILFYSAVISLATQVLYLRSEELYRGEGGIHIEILLLVFVLGVIIKHKEHDVSMERKASTGISFFFMLLVEMNMPHFIGVNFTKTHTDSYSVTKSQEMMSWGVIMFHVVTVSLPSNIGKLCPMFLYRDRKLSEWLVLSVGMFTRGGVGAGIIFAAPGYSLGGLALVISVLALILNLILMGTFVFWVKNLALRSYVD